VTVKRIEDMEAAFGGAFLLARASLGVTSFGMQVLNLPPEWSGPEHAHHGMTGEMEHANDGQEEVYIPLEGSAALLVEGGEITLEPGIMVRCGPSQVRQLVTSTIPARLLVIGAIPGRKYTPPAFTELPQPTPAG
jgi:uncharacterized cupin superfamily protein